ncbi:hypothetical protein FQN53_000158 [Emmonsiellopsis sp. PD_33]|nr:hypothetical protein FQN53_000158 [Emmonsiellopsis sp. PD_33]
MLSTEDPGRQVHIHPASTGVPLNSRHATLSRHHSMPYQKAQSTMDQSSRTQDQQHPTDLQHIWIITGPAGCGKSTVGENLSKALNMDFLEGDNQYHPDANKEKMKNCIPLTDEDRWDWLISLRDAAVESLQTHSSVVVACSALKKKYRDVMRVAAYNHPSVKIHFIYLSASFQVIFERVKRREDHYMSEKMVKSQFDALEEPDQNSEQDAVTVSTENVTKDEVQQEVLRRVDEIMAEYQ